MLSAKRDNYFVTSERIAVVNPYTGQRIGESMRMLITGEAEPTPWDRGVILQGHRTVESYLSFEAARERTAASVGKKSVHAPHMIMATKSEGGGVDRRKIDLSFLKEASSAYQISPDPRNYVFVSLPIVTAGIPNRNMDCFTHKELIRWSPLIGRTVYGSFIGKPTHVDHDNKDPSKAKGIHLDSTFRRYSVQPGNLGYEAQTTPLDMWKVRILTGWCREKDPDLVNAILKRVRTAYSMGAMIDYAVCSIPSCRRITTPKPCPHIAAGKGTVINGNIAYDEVYGCNFVETSNLGKEPADPDAFEKDAIWSMGREAA